MAGNIQRVSRITTCLNYAHNTYNRKTTMTTIEIMEPKILSICDLVKLLQIPGYKLVMTAESNWRSKYKINRITSYNFTPNRISAIIHTESVDVNLYPSTVILHYVKSNTITISDKDMLYSLKVCLEHEEQTIAQLLES